VLPKVIKNLVDRRRAVKGLMKKETNPEKHDEVSSITTVYTVQNFLSSTLFSVRSSILSRKLSN
jgi:hypothetical protein